MAHFRGWVKGARGLASRLGSRHSGLNTDAASWQGAVHVWLFSCGGKDIARVTLEPHHGHGVNRVLYDGPVSGADPDAWSETKGGDRND